jgi:hypothetical protein
MIIWDDDEPADPAHLAQLRKRAAYEKRKKDLSRAWISPPVAPWRAAQPRYWNDPPTEPVTAVTVPAAVNPRKGSGPLTPEEIAEYRAAEREAFAERLRERWRWNLYHL